MQAHLAPGQRYLGSEEVALRHLRQRRLLLRHLPGRGHVAQREQHFRQQVEQGKAIQRRPGLCGKRLEQHGAGHLWVAPGQIQPGQRELGRPLVFESCQQRAGFFQLALADPQVGQLKEGLDAQAAMPHLEGRDGPGQGRFGLLPAAKRRHQAAVGGPAIGGQVGDVKAFGIIGGQPAPLFAAHQVAGRFAGR